MQRYLNPNKLKLISKGVDSVRSRVLNLKDQFPNISKDTVFEAIEKSFLKFHNRDKNESEKIYINDENSNENPKIKELFEYYNSWDWKFGESPEFTNSIIHKFTWGLVDLNLRVEKGLIYESTIFSDCLNTEFIDNVNLILAKFIGKFTYDSTGIFNLLDQILKSYDTINNDTNNYIEEMKKELPKLA